MFRRFAHLIKKKRKHAYDVGITDRLTVLFICREYLLTDWQFCLFVENICYINLSAECLLPYLTFNIISQKEKHLFPLEYWLEYFWNKFFFNKVYRLSPVQILLRVKKSYSILHFFTTPWVTVVVNKIFPFLISGTISDENWNSDS